MLPQIGIHTTANALPFIMPVVLALPPDLVHILMPESEVHTSVAENLRGQGFTVLSFTPEETPLYAFIVLDQWYLIYSDMFTRHIQAGTRFLCLQHSTDNYGVSIPHAHYSIRAHKMLAQCSHEKDWTISRDTNPDRCDQLCTLPPDAKEEFAYSGPYHIGDWLHKRHLPKQQIREEMEDVLGLHLPYNKPVVACFLDEISHEGQFVAGLRALSQHALIIYKTYLEHDPRIADLAGVVLPWPDTTFAPNVLRFGADVILAGYNSGTFVTAVMLGLRVLPFYTRMIHYEGHSVTRLSSYTRMVPTEYSSYINHNCLLGLDVMYDIQDTSTLVHAIHSEEAWKTYSERLPHTQHMAFGDYMLEGSVQKTAALILRAFRKGTFGADASVVHVRQEWLAQQGSANSRAHDC